MKYYCVLISLLLHSVFSFSAAADTGILLESGELVRPVQISSSQFGGALSWDGRIIVSSFYDSSIAKANGTLNCGIEGAPSCDFPNALLVKTVRMNRLKTPGMPEVGNAPFSFEGVLSHDFTDFNYFEKGVRRKNCKGNSLDFSTCNDATPFLIDGMDGAALYDLRTDNPNTGVPNRKILLADRSSAHIAIAKNPASESAHRANPFVCNQNGIEAPLGAGGQYECYDIIIVIANFPDGDIFKRFLEIASAKIRVKAFSAQGQRLDNPYVEDQHAKITRQFESITAPDNSLLNYIEPTLTADGRLLAFKGFYAYNNSPADQFQFSKWKFSDTQRLEVAYKEKGTFLNSNGYTETFQERYPFSQHPMLSPTGELCGPLQCVGNYNWLSQDGSDVFFTRNYTQHFDNKGGIVNIAMQASFMIVGRSTNWTTYLVDSGINSKRYFQTARTTSTGFTEGMWSSFPELKNKIPYPYTRSSGVYPIFAVGGDYGEASFKEFQDGNYLLYLHMNEAVTKTPVFDIACPRPNMDLKRSYIDPLKTPDTSGNFHTADLKPLEGAPLVMFPLEKYLDQHSTLREQCLNRTASPINWTVPQGDPLNPLDELDGLEGRSLSFKSGGHLEISASDRDFSAYRAEASSSSNPKVRPRASLPKIINSLSSERPLITIAFGLKFRQKPLIPANSSLALASQAGAWDVALDSSHRIVFSTTQRNGGIAKIFSTAIFGTDPSSCQEGKWCHIAVTYRIGIAPSLPELMVFLNAVENSRLSVPLPNEPIAKSTNPVFIGPKGFQSGNPPFVYSMDEFNLSKSVRTRFELARLAHVSIPNSSVFIPNEGSLPSSLLPRPGASVGDYRIPTPLQSIIEQGDSGKFDALSALGKKLFQDPMLNGRPQGQGISCSSCHAMDSRMMSDPKHTPFSTGALGNLTFRNSPPTTNRIFAIEQFFDGRAPSLYVQVLQPLFNPMEMNADPDGAAVITYLKKNYKADFENIFGMDVPPSKNALAKALSAFLLTRQTRETAGQRILRQAESKNDREIANFDSIKRGASLFANKAQCMNCHSGPRLTDEKFHNTGLNDVMDVQNPLSARIAPNRDEGRARVGGHGSELGSFKTPTLVGISETGPYFHNGSAASLNDVINFYSEGPLGDFNHVDPFITPLHLSQPEKDDLLNFLNSL